MPYVKISWHFILLRANVISQIFLSPKCNQCLLKKWISANMTHVFSYIWFLHLTDGFIHSRDSSFLFCSLLNGQCLEWPYTWWATIHWMNKWVDTLALQPEKAINNTYNHSSNNTFSRLWWDPFCGQLNKQQNWM